MERPVRIRAVHVSKKFDQAFRRDDGALARVLELFSRKRTKREVSALDDVSFEARAGEIIGLIGRNGSGKSTLLRIIAEIYFPDRGHIKTHGKVLYLSGLGQGLVPRLTMRENIFLMSSLMGLTQKDLKKRFDEIVDFSGLKDSLDVKVYQFSSGMTARLSFAVTIHCIQHHSPETILFDEVFGTGGDLDFQNHALGKMEELIRGGATVILAGHSLGVVKKHCSRVILLEKGRIIQEGDPSKVVESYIATVLRQT